MKQRVNALGKPNRTYSKLPVCVLCATTAIALTAQTPTTLLSFNNTDGATPNAPLVQATNGNLYGTTNGGGANNSCLFGCGTVFKITPGGTLTTLYSFCSQSNCTDGANPLAGLAQATNGDFYGTTFNGGAHGNGTVFKITPSGALTTLYNFCSQVNCTDGGEPVAPLVQAANGDLYGTTAAGGGTVFKITPSGTLTTLYSFCSLSNCADGYDPQGALVQATNGDLYGTTIYGGANGNYGTVFKITPSGTLTTLYSFCSQSGCTDGSEPTAALVQGTDGNFYGTASNGGANLYDGTVFKITPDGALTTLHTFDFTDGSGPNGLVQATDGNFYGTTGNGGAHGDPGGTIFRITASGTLTTLFSFCSQTGCTDGWGPLRAPIQDTNGNLYGTTGYGGANSCIIGATNYGCGTAYTLSVGLGPFVKTTPTSGKVGAHVKILGTNLAGATSVTFNSTAAVFTVVSKTLITTTVPVGATTGKVKVVTPNRTLSSNVPFRVP